MKINLIFFGEQLGKLSLIHFFISFLHNFALHLQQKKSWMNKTYLHKYKISSTITNYSII